MFGDPGKTKLKSLSLLSGLLDIREPQDDDKEELDEGGEQEADDPDERGAFNVRFEFETFTLLMLMEAFEVFKVAEFNVLPFNDLPLFRPVRQLFFIKFHSIDCLLASSACVTSLPRLNVLPKIEFDGDHKFTPFDAPVPFTAAEVESLVNGEENAALRFPESAFESVDKLLPSELVNNVFSGLLGDKRRVVRSADDLPLPEALEPFKARARLLVVKSRHWSASKSNEETEELDDDDELPLRTIGALNGACDNKGTGLLVERVRDALEGSFEPLKAAISTLALVLRRFNFKS